MKKGKQKRKKKENAFHNLLLDIHYWSGVPSVWNKSQMIFISNQIMTFKKETETKKELLASDLEYLESYTRFEKSEIVDWFR